MVARAKPAEHHPLFCFASSWTNYRRSVEGNARLKSKAPVAVLLCGPAVLCGTTWNLLEFTPASHARRWRESPPRTSQPDCQRWLAGSAASFHIASLVGCRIPCCRLPDCKVSVFPRPSDRICSRAGPKAHLQSVPTAGSVLQQETSAVPYGSPQPVALNNIFFPAFECKVSCQ